MLIDLLSWCDPKRNSQKSPKPHRPSCLSGARRGHVWGPGCRCRELRSWGLIVARWLAWGHSMFHLEVWNYRVVGGIVDQQWWELERCVGLDGDFIEVGRSATHRIRVANRAEIWWRFHRIIWTWCSRATGSPIITTSNNMCMLPNAIYRTCWFTHRSGLEFHGCGSLHCFPSAMSAARAQVLIKPKTTLHASVIFSKGCNDRTRSATAALEHPKTRTARRWLAKSVLIMLENILSRFGERCFTFWPGYTFQMRHCSMHIDAYQYHGNWLHSHKQSEE